MLLVLVFGVGGSVTSSLFLKYWFSLLATGSLLAITLILLRCGAASRRGNGPVTLACAGAPCMLLQPLLLTLQSIETRVSFFSNPAVFYGVTTATWCGVGAVVSASLWNASIDTRLLRLWAQRRASSLKPLPQLEQVRVQQKQDSQK